jgi:hypothetical protein
MRKRSLIPFAEVVAGGCAGLIATAPMTVVMEAVFRRLPQEQRYPLPPAQITDKVIERGTLGRRLDQPKHTVLTLAAHFGYGAAAGAVCGPLTRRIPLPHPISGLLVGSTLYAGSYLGWIPAVGILRPATGWPKHRAALMFVAHLVWGATLDLLMQAAEPLYQPSGHTKARLLKRTTRAKQRTVRNARRRARHAVSQLQRSA